LWEYRQKITEKINKKTEIIFILTLNFSSVIM
jgi:hypothetical protein